MSQLFSVDGNVLSWTETCEYAAEMGDVALLEYAHKKGGELTEEVLDNALKYSSETGDDACYAYIYEQQCSINNLIDDIDSMMI